MSDAIIVDIPHSWIESSRIVILFAKIIEKFLIICLDVSDFDLAAPFDILLEVLSVTMS